MLEVDKTDAHNSIISFDFDGVLHKSVIEGTTHPINFDRPTTWKPFAKMHQLLCHLAEEHRIVVVTKRDEYMFGDTQFFIDLFELPVSKLYCTSGDSKWDLLEELGVITHYDDDHDMIDEYEGDARHSSVKLVHVDVQTEILTEVN